MYILLLRLKICNSFFQVTHDTGMHFLYLKASIIKLFFRFKKNSYKKEHGFFCFQRFSEKPPRSFNKVLINFLKLTINISELSNPN